MLFHWPGTRWRDNGNVFFSLDDQRRTLYNKQYRLCWLLGISDLKSGFSQNLKGEIDPVLPIYPLFTDRSLTLNQDGVCALTESASGTSTPSRAGFFPLGKQKEKTECPKASYSVSAPFGMGLREALHRFFALWQFQRNVHRITHQAMSTHAL
jgi:hypothetical protein